MLSDIIGILAERQYIYRTAFVDISDVIRREII